MHQPIPLRIPPGVFRPSTGALARGRWYDANLVRWRGQHMLPVGGWDRLTSAPLASRVRKMLTWRDLSDIRRTCFLCDENIITLEGSTYTDRTPADFVGDRPSFTSAGFGIGPYSDDFYGTPRAVGNPRLYLRASAWSLDTFGEDMMLLASSDGRLMRLSPSGAVLTQTAPPIAPRPLPDVAEVIVEAPIANRAMVVTEERHVMLFGAGGNPRRVAWCSREDFRDWDFSSTTNTAGFFDLDTPGWIVNAVKVRGGVLIFTDTDIWLARYRGQPFVYGYERIGSRASLIAPMAFAATVGSAMWMGSEGFWMFDGGTVRPVPCDVEGFVYNALDPITSLYRSHAGVNGAFSEAWFFYPTKGNEECDRYVAFNFTPGENWWSIGALSRTAIEPKASYPYPLMAGPQGHIFQHENGWLDAGQTRVGKIWAETAPLTLPVSGARRVHVLQAQLDSLYGAQRATLTAITKETHDDPAPITHGPYTPRSDGWTDARFSGRDVSLRITNREDGDFTVGEMRFFVSQGGGR